ncbi:phosphopantetheine-binding protein [Streptomyces sp. NBC_00006]|uniref:acyl carrier protein n=1 Tax=unclassified Streptomyces TaxID=2593676 RepID=UPI00225B646E|nr:MULTISPECIES: phosphopantetheine-binding protein [unclassified Streptomyces]MCX4830202.1 phosphopantetheine-binding protein [Streptomyces sp. NBC_01016]MCX5530468.1 phosphopantetheine-binding protein [Streptomyces sp. NBC_00006]
MAAEALAPPEPLATPDLITGMLVDTFEVDRAAVTSDALMTDLLVDSLMAVELAVTLKDQLGVTVTEDELRELPFAEFSSRVDARRGR